MPAIGHEYPMKLYTATSYCGIYNLLDFAAGTVRVTSVTTEDERNLEEYPVVDPWYQMAKEATEVHLYSKLATVFFLFLQIQCGAGVDKVCVKQFKCRFHSCLAK